MRIGPGAEEDAEFEAGGKKQQLGEKERAQRRETEALNGNRERAREIEHEHKDRNREKVRDLRRFAGDEICREDNHISCDVSREKAMEAQKAYGVGRTRYDAQKKR